MQVGFTVAQAISSKSFTQNPLLKMVILKESKINLADRINFSPGIRLKMTIILLYLAGVNASSFISNWNDAKLKKVDEHVTDHCLLQFPVTSSVIDRIEIDILLVEKQELTIKIFEGTGFHNALPGYCLHSDEISVAEDCKCLSIEYLKLESKNRLALSRNSVIQKFSVPLFASGLVGYVLHSKRNQSISKKKYLSDFEPVVTKDPLPFPFSEDYCFSSTRFTRFQTLKNLFSPQLSSTIVI